MITTELKDCILQELVNSNTMHFTVSAMEECKKFNIDMESYIAILDYFQRLSFVKLTKCMGGEIYVRLMVEASDFVRLGGFHAQEDLLKNNIDKLNLEIQSLSKELNPSFKERLERITSLGCKIISALTYFK